MLDKQEVLVVPILKSVLGERWDELPSVLHKHYTVRPYSDDTVRVEGVLDISVSRWVSFLARVTGMLLPYSGKNIPVTVLFQSGKNSSAFQLNRTFHFPDRGDVNFYSSMEMIGGNEVVEFMRFGIGWKLAYHWDGYKMLLSHRGYILRLRGAYIPLPLSWFMGVGYAEEVPLSDNRFSMRAHTHHRFFGKLFAYSGYFDVTEVTCKEKY